MKPLVSVLTTTYNREQYIATAIRSVLKSTFPNFELIIVDDNSKDKTVEIIKKFAQKDQRIKFFINDINIGDYPNRNKAASHAQGKYIKYLDADDFIYPWGLEVLVQTMENYPEARWGMCNLAPCRKKPFPFQLSPKEAYRYHYNGPGLFNKSPLAAIIRTEVFREVNGFVEERMVGDHEMWHKLALNYPVVVMPQGLVWYRHHDQQEMNDYAKYISKYYRIEESYLNNSNCPLNKDEILKFKKRKRRKIITELVIGLVKLNFSSIKQSISKLMYV